MSRTTPISTRKSSREGLSAASPAVIPISPERRAGARKVAKVSIGHGPSTHEALANVLLFPPLSEDAPSAAAAATIAVQNAAALEEALRQAREENKRLREQVDDTATAVPRYAMASRPSRREPRASDLREYEGGAGAKLDSWLQEFAIQTRYFRLSGVEAVEFASTRLRGPALQWWLSLNEAELKPIDSEAALGAALRSRFQPITAQRTAREQLRALKQSSRTVHDYISEFQRLHSLLPGMEEADLIFLFESGLNSAAIRMELRKVDPQNLKEAYALAARLASIDSAHSPSAPTARVASTVNQIETEEDNHSRLDRMEATLNALAAAQGMGTKTQTTRGYQQDHHGTKDRFGNRRGPGGAPTSQRLPDMLGLPAALVEQRRAADQCYRCGSSQHKSYSCPNAVSSSSSSN
jgi:hypothetical protein